MAPDVRAVVDIELDDEELDDVGPDDVELLSASSSEEPIASLWLTQALPVVGFSSTVVGAAAAAARIAAPAGGGMAALPAGQAAPRLGPPGGGDAAAQASELDTMIDMSAVEGKVKASSVQKISELVTNHPGETVAVIRGWLSTENQ